MYLSRSIRPNKYPKIKFKIGSKARLSPSLSFLLLRGKFKRSNVITQGAKAFCVTVNLPVRHCQNHSNSFLLSLFGWYDVMED